MDMYTVKKVQFLQFTLNTGTGTILNVNKTDNSFKAKATTSVHFKHCQFLYYRNKPKIGQELRADKIVFPKQVPLKNMSLYVIKRALFFPHNELLNKILANVKILSCSVWHPTRIPLTVMHSSLVISQTALLCRPIIAFVAGEGDASVLGHLVHLETVGLRGLIVALVAGVAATLVYGQLVLPQIALPRCTVRTTSTLPSAVSLHSNTGRYEENRVNGFNFYSTTVT
jgi:hypothetical protein